MIFDSFAFAQDVYLWGTFVIAVLMGAVINKTNFCTMGAVSDWVNMGDMGRLRAWMWAIAVSTLGMVLLEWFGVLNVDSSFPPYRSERFIWIENVIGGLLFGVGMTFAGGCGSKNLVRLGAGNIKSLFVLLIIGVIAYYMTNPFPGSDQTLYSLLFLDWAGPLAVNLGTTQDLGALLSTPDDVLVTRLVIGVALAAALVLFCFRSSDFRTSFDLVLSGLVVGLAVLGAWYITATASIDLDGETYTVQEYIQQWDFLAEDSEDVKPADSRPYNAQSFTFVNPVGQSVGYGMQGFQPSMLTFGVMATAGVLVGSFLWSLLSGTFRIEWFASIRDAVANVGGATLMGFGGVLALGCTVGQAISGVSTLALGSFITLVSIIFGSALTMKIQLYRMVYEGAGFFSVLIAALADFKLLPNRLRRLDAV
jgi:uncharacterized membrane protein YedE/YeeE